MALTREQKDRRNDLRAQHEFARLRDVKSAILSIFRDAMKKHLSFSEILERRGAVYSRPAYLKLNGRHRDQVSGFCEALFDLINAEHLDWRLTLPDGSWVDAGEYPYSKVDCRSYDMMGAHFWKGTDIPYNDIAPMHGGR